jgi:osmotically-inducible protein OsmY
MKNDDEIARHVVDELRWAPELDERDIAVKVTDGVVTLTGFVSSLREASDAERAAKRIAGVRALANDLQLRPGNGEAVADPELARLAADALERELPFSAPLIRISVHEGAVTLEGTVEWGYQKTRAAEAIANIRGVRRLNNLITLKGRPLALDIKDQIAAAFQRSAQLDANSITVDINDDTVTLKGHVHSWAEHEAAAEIAWCAPGVRHVKNHICVGT